jgi:hypothetical protein
MHPMQGASTAERYQHEIRGQRLERPPHYDLDRIAATYARLVTLTPAASASVWPGAGKALGPSASFLLVPGRR